MAETKDASKAEEWKTLGNAAFSQQKYVNACALYTKAIECNPDCAGGCFALRIAFQLLAGLTIATRSLLLQPGILPLAAREQWFGTRGC